MNIYVVRKCHATYTSLLFASLFSAGFVLWVVLNHANKSKQLKYEGYETKEENELFYKGLVYNGWD